MKLSDGEKLILMMLTEIYQHLGIQGDLDPKFVQAAIHSGNAWGLSWKYPGVFDVSETPEEVVHEVVHILDMWSMIESAYSDLSIGDRERIARETSLGDNVVFRGFDGNNESEYLNVAHFLIDDLDRFSIFKERHDLNSHMPSIDTYRRMFQVFEPMRANMALGDNRLSATQIIEILKARIHPSRRGGD